MDNKTHLQKYQDTLYLSIGIENKLSNLRPGDSLKLAYAIKQNSDATEFEYIKKAFYMDKTMVSEEDYKNVFDFWQRIIDNDRLRDNMDTLPIGIVIGNIIQSTKTQDALNVKRPNKNENDNQVNVVIPNISTTMLYTNKSIKWIRVMIDREDANNIEFPPFMEYRYTYWFNDKVAEIYFTGTDVDELFKFIDDCVYIKSMAFYSDLRNITKSKKLPMCVRISNYIKFMYSYLYGVLWPGDECFNGTTTERLMLLLVYGCVMLDRQNMSNGRHDTMTPLQAISGTSPHNALIIRARDENHVIGLKNQRDNRIMGEPARVYGVSDREIVLTCKKIKPDS
jgi:hypothetical protein